MKMIQITNIDNIVVSFNRDQFEKFYETVTNFGNLDKCELYFEGSGWQYLKTELEHIEERIIHETDEDLESILEHFFYVFLFPEKYEHQSANALYEINNDTIIRVYEDGTFVIMISGNDLSENSDYANIPPILGFNFSDYIDNDHAVEIDDCGAKYVEWINGDFYTPFKYDDKTIRQQIEYYESFLK